MFIPPKRSFFSAFLLILPLHAAQLPEGGSTFSIQQACLLEDIVPTQAQLIDREKWIQACKNVWNDLQEEQRMNTAGATQAIAVMKLYAFCAAHPIPSILLANMLNIKLGSLNEYPAVQLLLEHKILQEDAGAGSYHAYYLHQQEIKRKVFQADQECEVLKGLVSIVVDSWKYDYYQPSTWEPATAMAPHLRVCWNYVKDSLAYPFDHPNLLLQCINQLGQHLIMTHAAYDAAITLLKEATTPGKRWCVQPCIRVMRYVHLAKAYELMEAYKECVTILHQGLDIWKIAGKPMQSFTVAHIYNGYGNVFYRHEKWKLAKGCYKDAIQYSGYFYKRTRVPHPAIAMFYNNLGNAYYQMDDAYSVLICYKKSLSINKNTIEADHPHTATNHTNIGNVYMRGNTPKAFGLAIQHYTQARKIYKALYPRRPHPDLARAHTNLAHAYYANNQNELAIGSYAHALTDYCSLYPEGHADTAENHGNLGNAYHAAGKHEEAITSHNKAIAMCAHIFGKKHHRTARAHEALGAIHYAIACYEAAITSFSRTVEIDKAPNNTAYLANDYHNLAKAYSAAGDHKEASRYFDEERTAILAQDGRNFRYFKTTFKKRKEEKAAQPTTRRSTKSLRFSKKKVPSLERTSLLSSQHS